jgi:hypothetical protein
VHPLSRPIDTALWQQLTQDLTTEMANWRQAHPSATLRELEEAFDARLNHLRARLLEDLALTSTAAEWRTEPAASQPRCAQCGVPLESKGSKSRTLQTHGGQTLTLERSYAVCPVCSTGLFPPR